MARKAKPIPEPKIQSYETYYSYWDVHKDDTPSCFNSNVRVRKYRFTRELIDEPLEVIQARIIDLWEHCHNHHHFHAIQKTGKDYGLGLDISTFGIKHAK
jgi:hypothetical protein